IRDNYNISPLIIEGPFIWTQNYLDQEIEQGATFIIKKYKSLNIRFFRHSNKHKPFPSQAGKNFNVGTNEDGSTMLMNMGFMKEDFDYPKPVELLKKIILSKGFFDKYELVLDYFAGSGTTGHAVFNLNREDNGHRK